MKTPTKIKHSLLFAACTSLIIGCGQAPEKNVSADAVYLNATVYTQSKTEPYAQAFAVKDGKFQAVGDKESITTYIGENTQVFDLDKKFVMPGLIDEHIHPDLAAENFMGINVNQNMTWQEMADVIREVTQKTPGEGWIIGGAIHWLDIEGKPMLGTDVASHYSTLDSLVNDRPVMLWDVGGHALLLNSFAMKLLNYTKDSQPPEGGIYDRDIHGELTGVFREIASNVIYEQALEKLPRGRELIDKGIKPIFGQLNQMGITSISDAWARYYMLDAYKEMAQKAELTVRINAYISDPIEWKNEVWKEKARWAIDNYDEYRVGDWLKADSVKFVLDGSAGGQTIIMVEPYEGTTDVHGGPWRNDPDYFAQKFAEYDKKGLTMKVHAVGTQSIRTALDAIENARKAGSTLRHNIGHTVFVHPDDKARFKELDAGAEFSPHFWYPVPGWDMIREELGQRRLDWVFPFNSFKQDNVHISVGSDWPVAASPNPFYELETMITRQVPGGKSSTLPDENERISLKDAIEVFTLGGAYAQNREHLLGSIEVGKLADFVVVNQNLFEIPVTTIHQTKVLKTVVDGKVVFELQQ